jgi:membrane protein DedA with SNARE-associated domain
MELLYFIERLFAEYGYLVLLVGLPLDAIALPIPPGNTTLAYTGYLSYKGVLELLPAMASAYAGAVGGITATYWIGRKVGMPLVERYGKWLFLKEVHMEKARRLYGKYGNRVLLFSFFMPGIRQVIGYFAGIIGIPFRSFASYSYIGAALWVAGFFGIGYAFGEHWQAVFLWVEQAMKYGFIGLCAAAAAFLVLKRLGLWRTKLKKADGESL